MFPHTHEETLASFAEKRYGHSSRRIIPGQEVLIVSKWPIGKSLIAVGEQLASSLLGVTVVAQTAVGCRTSFLSSLFLMRWKLI